MFRLKHTSHLASSAVEGQAWILNHSLPRMCICMMFITDRVVELVCPSSISKEQ